MTLETGDVVVLPAGTGHKCERASGDILIVGAYADGRDYDIRRGATPEKEEVRANITSVPDPERDPVTGARALFNLDQLPAAWNAWSTRPTATPYPVTSGASAPLAMVVVCLLRSLR